MRRKASIFSGVSSSTETVLSPRMRLRRIPRSQEMISSKRVSRFLPCSAKSWMSRMTAARSLCVMEFRSDSISAGAVRPKRSSAWSSVMPDSSPPKKEMSWSSRDCASRIPPSAAWAITLIAASEILTFSASAIMRRRAAMADCWMRRRSNLWQREMTVGRTLLTSVVAKMNLAWAGGSSMVLRRAFHALLESMWTSSMM